MNCVVIILWSSRIMNFMLFTLENRVLLLQMGSMVWNRSLPLINSFSKTEIVIFPMQAVIQ